MAAFFGFAQSQKWAMKNRFNPFIVDFSNFERASLSSFMEQSVGSTLLGALHRNSLQDVFRHVRRTDGQSDHVRFVRVRSENSCESDGTGNPESCPGKE